MQINSEQTAVIIPSQMLANDYDPEGSELNITDISNISGGTAELRQGLVFFTPNDSALPLSFDYTVSDSASLETTATVYLSERPPLHNAPGSETLAEEHRALFVTLINRNGATNVAVQDGLWSDSETWSNGVVPEAGDRVLVHRTVEVVYDVQSDVPIEWLRVDGVLMFLTDSNTRLLVETFVSDPRGTINIRYRRRANRSKCDCRDFD